MSRRARGALIAGAVAAGGWALALVFVRVSLDWSDSQPYRGAETEARYIVFAVTAVAIAAAATAAAIVVWVRSRRG